MPLASVLSLWAVHIADGLLSWPWLVGGFLGAGLLALLGGWRMREDEIPQVALLTAVFFVASLVHVTVGPTSVHLLFNGLIGLVLGRRACLAIPLGLFLQAALFQHGGFTTLGINSCIMVLPALLAWQMFAALRRMPWVRRPWFRTGLVAASALGWVLSCVYSVALICSNPVILAVFSQQFGSAASETAVSSGTNIGPFDLPDLEWANFITFHPATLAAALAVACLAAWAERRLRHAPEFPLGLLIGETAVLATLFLNWLVLNSQPHWRQLALVIFIAHLPIAVVEGIVLGFTVGFLVRVKPSLLGWPAEPMAKADAELPPQQQLEAEKGECSAERVF